MKKILVMAGMVLLAASCSNESVDVVDNAQTEEAVAPVRVHVNGFSVATEDFSGERTRANEDLADYVGVDAVTLAFYNGNTEVRKITQLKANASTYTTFGEFNVSLPMGSYTMVVVACHVSESSPFELTSPTAASFTGEHAFETFTATQAVTISSTADVDISATLNRVVSKLQIISTDGKTADVKRVRMTFAGGGKSFNPTTGLATVNTGFAHSVGNSVATGETSNSFGFLFLASDEQTMDVTIETLGESGNVIVSKTVKDVPFKRNRVTILTGALYSKSGVASFQVSTNWLKDMEVNF